MSDTKAGADAQPATRDEAVLLLKLQQANASFDTRWRSIQLWRQTKLVEEK